MHVVHAQFTISVVCWEKKNLPSIVFLQQASNNITVHVC